VLSSIALSIPSSESALHAPSPESECCPPPPQGTKRGWGTNSLRGRGEPFRTTGEKAWYSVYSVCLTITFTYILKYCKIWPVIVLCSYQKKETACRMLMLLLAKSTCHRLLIYVCDSVLCIIISDALAYRRWLCSGRGGGRG
jgi:hypothetical protein